MNRGFLRGKQLDTSITSVPLIDIPREGKIQIPSESIVPDPDSIPTTFPNDREGLLFVTLPPRDAVGPNEPVTECILRPSVKEKILAIPGFPHPFSPPDPPRYQIKPIPGAGLGMVATVDIDVGEDIAIERPLTVTTQAIPGVATVPCLHPREFYRVLLERLDEKSYEELFALHNCKGNTRPEFMGIIDTNGIGIGTLPGYPAACAAVCKVISRANHSCCSNAVWRFHVESFTVHLRAILPIKKGEEIFVSYGYKERTRARRQKYLLERYKFRCTCFACASNTIDRDQARMMAVIATHPKKCEDDSTLRSWVTDRTKADDLIIAEARVMINIMEDEKFCYSSLWPVWYQRIVKAYCALEDEENARKWAQKAAKLARAWALHDGGWDAVAKNPRMTDWWGLRANTRSGIRMVGDLDDLNVRRDLLNTNRAGPGALEHIATSMKAKYPGLG
ncbi:hypothetical protein QCA50_016558 [Cerrena zonata]|uniref:SET domain-containing protein n=1 Tax=Cerrena zonata TaxID=2478898 RepID=A0AAW0FF43_9APHY